MISHDDTELPEEIPGDPVDDDSKKTDESNLEGEDKPTEFVPWVEQNFQEVPVSSLAHRTVVKGEHIESDQSVLIRPKIPIHSDEDGQQGEITPIIENDQIIGVRVECHCGTIHEVLFDFAS